MRPVLSTGPWNDSNWIRPRRAYADGGLIRSYVVDGEPVTAFHDNRSGRRSLIGGVVTGVVSSPAGGAAGGTDDGAVLCQRGGGFWVPGWPGRRPVRRSRRALHG